jgi:hypothetical protein
VIQGLLCQVEKLKAGEDKEEEWANITNEVGINYSRLVDDDPMVGITLNWNNKLIATLYKDGWEISDTFREDHFVRIEWENSMFSVKVKPR